MWPRSSQICPTLEVQRSSLIRPSCSYIVISLLSLDVTVSDAQESPVIVYARLMKGGLPVLEAGVTVDVYLPGEFPHASVGDTTRYQLELRDDGLGM